MALRLVRREVKGIGFTPLANGGQMRPLQAYGGHLLVPLEMALELRSHKFIYDRREVYPAEVQASLTSPEVHMST